MATLHGNKLREKYQILEHISEGTFGSVYKVRDLKHNQIYAMKKIISNKKNHQNFVREALILSTISHENIIKVHDYEIKDNSVCLIMEYCEKNLQQFLQSSIYPLNKQTVKTILYMLLRGLSELHSRKIIHRDLKPSNILINSHGVIKLADFGLAISLNDKDHEGHFDIEGFTTWYKSPELLFGSRSYDCSTDMWSFSCIVGEMLNGAPLFPGANDQHMISKISCYIGSPCVENWPTFIHMPDYGKVSFTKSDPGDFDELFPDATNSEIEVLRCILRFDQRATADQVLRIKFFEEYPPPLKKINFEEERPKEPVKKYDEIFNIKS